MGARLQICGAVVDGPPPLGLIDLPLGPGCQALYGLNGVGKSRLLAAVSDLCGGSKHGDGYLYGRLIEGDSGPDEEDEIGELCDALENELNSQYRWSTPQIIELDEQLEPLSGDSLDRFKGLMLRMLLLRSTEIFRVNGQIDLSYLREIADQGWLILRPAGGDSWQLEAGLRIPDSQIASHDLERLAAWRDRLLTLCENVHDPDDIERAWNSIDDRPVAHDSILTGLGGLWDSLHSGAAFLEDLALYTTHPLVVRPVLQADPMDAQRPFVTRFADIPLFERITDEDLRPSKINDITRNTMPLWHLSTGRRPKQWSSSHERKTITTIGDGAAPSVELLETAADLTTQANSIHRTFGSDNPELRCHIFDPDEWFFGEAVQWQCLDDSGEWVALAELSPARARWACLAALVTVLQRDEGLTAIDDYCGRFLIALDEPESGLHARAERESIQSLAVLAESAGASVLISTHSRWALNDPGISPLHVFRSGRGTTAVAALTAKDRMDLKALGLAPADAIQMIRAFLIVEGRHDEVVLGELLGEELEKRDVRIIPIRGAKNLASLADAHLLADLVDVPLVVMLDNARTDQIRAYLCDLEKISISDTEAIDALPKVHFGNAKRAEEGYITQLARRLHEQGRLSRCTIHGLSLTDIIRYLPAEALVPGATSWADLDDAHQGQSAIKDFKKWATQKRTADFSDPALIAACNIDEIHPDFTDLLEAVDRVI